MPASRPCTGCGKLIDKGAYRGRCRDCLRSWKRSRGTKAEQGYGSAMLITPLGPMTFDQCRREYARRMASGVTYDCACGCGEPVDPTGFHLGHADNRTMIVGPQRPYCNLRDAGRASHRQ